jgi:hypothetical protein
MSVPPYVPHNQLFALSAFHLLARHDIAGVDYRRIEDLTLLQDSKYLTQQRFHLAPAHFRRRSLALAQDLFAALHDNRHFI